MLSFLYVYSDHSILECYNLFSGVELSMRWFFVIIDPFGEHDRTESRSDENIPLSLVTPAGGGSIWEPEREQETSFRGLSGTRARPEAAFVEDKVNELYEILSEHFPNNQVIIYYDDFESI